ncbi:hypothetical protein DFR27_0658 [Umboniibacter marinipuniceus]|uniref:Uncharacterized protein n=1 Tax=Umboniibacter marinipuniceus TaxID=569599 RepID=A0A3M0AC17_9GAMM|nr:hypothetical protein DFR27_0658 [Umboniibacter marinipuniceus]
MLTFNILDESESYEQEVRQSHSKARDQCI